LCRFAEVYSTGRAKYAANTHAHAYTTITLRTLTPATLYVRSLPGSRTERSLNASFYRMLPELLRYSSAHQLVDHIPESVQAVHRGMPAAASLAAPVAPVPRRSEPEPASESDEEEVPPDHPDEADIDDDMLGALGL
jgi:hypothetical protein